jgi:photosystem II stability/assembly factor-like uncharacterized protein
MNFKWYSRLLLAAIAFLYLLYLPSCGKDGASPPKPVDTLDLGWQKIMVTEAPGALMDIFFVNNNVGWVGGDNFLAKSTDGGLTWTKQQVTGANIFINNLFFVDAQYGWVIAHKKLYRTRNGGGSWDSVTVSGVTDFGDIQFLNPRLGYLVSKQGFYRSVDSGATWTKLSATNANYEWASLSFVDSLRGWTTGYVGLAYTSDGGNSFVQYTGDPRGYSIQFIDPLTGWTAGGTCMRTVNGSSFTNMPVGYHTHGDVHFFNQNEGYVCSGDEVYKSNNGGQTLSRVAKVVDSQGFVELHFTDANHGWVANYDKFILRYVQ